MMNFPITPLYKHASCDGMKGLKAFLYCRVAHDDGSTLELQIDELRHYAEQAGFIIVSIAAEYAGGRTLDRTALKQVTQAVCDSKADIVLVKNVSRITRDIFQLQDYIDILTAHNTALYCIQEQILFKGEGI